jgi:hypothetical protein
LLSIKKSGDIVNKTSKKKYYNIEATFSKKIVLKKKKKKEWLKILHCSKMQKLQILGPSLVFRRYWLFIRHKRLPSKR